jgi:alpha-mannosidase
MSSLPSEPQLEAFEEALAEAVHPQAIPLQIAAHRVGGEPVDLSGATVADYQPFEVGDQWGSPWDTVWFHMKGRVPEAWRGSEVVARIDLGYGGWTGFGAEGLVWRDGEPVGAINPKHSSVTLVPAATGGEEVEFHLEAAANPTPPMSEPHPLLMPDYHGDAIFRLERTDLAVFDRDAYGLLIDVRVLLGVAGEEDRDDRRRARILEAVSRAGEIFDPSQPSTIPEARDALAGVWARDAAPSHRVTAVGHAHIDTAWLWPLREGRRKCARTFATVLGLLDDYPDFVFVASAAQHYQWMKSDYPSLFERIRKQVAQGRWEPVGGMWVESDCNLPGGESLVRQFLYGKRFFLEEFGYECEDAWLPDVFGYPASLPQVMARAGIRYFLSQKLSWNDTNPFPHSTFLWEGIDGTRVLAHFPPADTYNGSFLVDELLRSAANAADRGAPHDSLYAFGYGDGGGGPTSEMLESAQRVQRLDGLPQVETGRALDFFRGLEEGAADLPVWTGELYLEYHRGTYTTHADVKRANRRCESLLREAEMWSALDDRDPYPREELEQAWKDLLTHQFHDILPGTSIHWVYEEAAEALGGVASTAGRIVGDRLRSLASGVDTSRLEDPMVVFNSEMFERDEVIAVEAGETAGLQMSDEGEVLVRARVPSCGYAAMESAGEPAAPPGEVAIGDGFLENEHLVVRWDDEGSLTSIWDREVEREVLVPGAPANLFQLFEDRPANWDAWDIDASYRERVEEVRDLESFEVTEEGPLRASVRFTRRVGSSRIVQSMRLCAGSRSVVFDTEVDWQETHRLLKVAFPVAVRSPEATYEIAFGHVNRATHEDTSFDRARFEVPAHRWADLSEEGYGVALMNDCKYGYDVHGNVMRLTLLRSPTWPDPVADRGRHRFCYALMPHPGDLQSAGVIEAAAAFNSPLRAVKLAPRPGLRPSRASFLRAEGLGVMLASVKKAEDSDDLVVRLYEAHGGRRGLVLHAPITKAERCDLLERPLGPVGSGEGRLNLTLDPFEIVTLRAPLAG